MLLLVVGLVWCVTNVAAAIPPWSRDIRLCTQESNIVNPCVYGNLNVTLVSKVMHPKDCNSVVDFVEFSHPPIIHINSTNATDRFTVMMVDLGPQGRGPNFLEWMVTNVTVDSLRHYNTIKMQDVVAGYNMRKPDKNSQTPGPHRTLVQILVFRHYNLLRVPFGELWVTQIRDFSLSSVFIKTNPTLRMCGPVAATQFWLYEADHTPSAPPAPLPGQPGQLGQPVQPIYVPVIPVVPVGQAPSQAPAPGYHPSSPGQQHGHTTFFKKSSAAVSKPTFIFIPLVILAVVWLWI